MPKYNTYTQYIGGGGHTLTLTLYLTQYLRWRRRTSLKDEESNGAEAHPPCRFFGFLAFLTKKGWVASPKYRNFRNFCFLGLPPGHLAPKIEIFEISGFWVCPLSIWPQKSKFSKFRVFWSKQPGLVTKKSKFQNFGYFGVVVVSSAPKNENFWVQNFLKMFCQFKHYFALKLCITVHSSAGQKAFQDEIFIALENSSS